MDKNIDGLGAVFDDADGVSWTLGIDDNIVTLGPFTNSNKEEFMRLDSPKVKFLSKLLDKYTDTDNLPEPDYGLDVDGDDDLESDINDAVDLILEMGSIDGADHKQWVLDQVLRILLRDNYDDTIERDELENESEWETGVAP